MKHLNIALTLIFLSSCSSVPLLESDTVGYFSSATKKISDSSRIPIQKTIGESSSPVVSGTKRSLASEANVPEEDLPADEVEGISSFELNYPPELYEFWIKYFTERDRDRFVRHQANGELFRETVEQILEEHGLPKELFYVGLIESGFNTSIRSHANAVGPWQFIKGTAVRYGLRVDSTLDERRSIHKSTHAAAGYFKDLYNIFGSWELALCAYNAGEYRIINAIRKGRTRDYQELVKKKLLPKETIYYIPKVAAARQLVLNREKYKFSNYTQEKSNGRLYANASSKTMYRPFVWRKVASELNLSHSAFLTLNPDFKTAKVGATSRNPVELYLPSKVDKVLAEEVAPKDIKFQVEDNPKVADEAVAPKTTINYKARRGDNFHALAKRFNVPVAELIEVNKISRGGRNTLYVGQRIKIPSGAKLATYKVRRGDNLTDIAKKHKTSIQQIVSVNNLRSKKIFIGQVLKIPN